MSEILINQLAESGKLGLAAIEIEKLISTNPTSPEAFHTLFLIRLRLNQKEQAINAISNYLELKGDDATAWMNKGNLLHELKQDIKALECYQKSIELDASNSLTFSNQANSYIALGMLEHALTCCDTAIEIDNTNRDGWMNKANVLFKMDKLLDAESNARKAVGISPKTPEPWVNLGRILNAQNRDTEALTCYENALSISPKFSQALINLGYTYARLGKTNFAVTSYEQAATYDPHISPEAQWNIGLIYLALGNLVEGWKLYESRWKMKEFEPQKSKSKSPSWDGTQSIKNKKVLVYAEQGLGDSIQFCRYLEKVESLGANVIFQVQKPLAALFKTLKGASKIITHGEVLPEHDFQVPLLSLPGIFKTELNSIPISESYLSVEPNRLCHWKEILQNENFRIGINWQGSHGTEIDRGRSFNVSLFKKISQIPGVQLISLQKGYGTEQLENLPAGMKVLELGESVDADGAFLDTAAVMRNLDLVISSDTAVVHLAGALGVKTWVPLKLVPDWRWLINRTDTPWYPSLTLYRQEIAGEWEPVFEKMRQDLIKEIKNK